MPKRKRPALSEGDVIGIPIPDKNVHVLGRVAITDAHAGAHGVWPGCIVLYVFRFSLRPDQPYIDGPLRVDDLLMPPFIVPPNELRKHVLLLASRPFAPGERLGVHCFIDTTRFTPVYYDERDKQLPTISVPCGRKAMYMLSGVLYDISQRWAYVVEYRSESILT